jgi:phospholipid/cholesterol/gamma-HCH transport system substrate-binding protein
MMRLLRPPPGGGTAADLGGESARLRAANRLAGALVLAALGLLLAGVLQGNLVRGWLNPPFTLRVVLPEAGVAGLSVGGEVQVLGTSVGRVTRIVIEPDRPLMAEAQIDRGAASFIRRDSRVFIRRQFGVAGAGFLEITRGSGAPLDWDYAVLTAEADRSASQNLDQLIQDLRDQIVPLIEDIGRTARNIANITENLAAPAGPMNSTLAALQETAQRIQRGEGNIGRLIADESVIGEVETILSRANAVIADLQAMSRALADPQQGVPGITRRASEAAGNVAQATRQAPTAARDVRVAASALPALLTQVQQASLELERLLTALRAHPLIGGGRTSEPADRLPPSEVRP